MGPTGTGKTVISKDLLLNGLAENYFTSITAFSANTNVGQVQDVLENRLER